MPRMTPQEEARYALDFGVSRDDLSPEVQALYDLLLAYHTEHPSSPLPALPSGIPDVYIKRTGWGLLTRIVTFTIFCSIMAGAATAGGGPFLLFLVIFWLPGAASAVVLHWAQLTTAGDVLTYQVPLRSTRKWHREEIAAFGLVPNWWASGATAHLIMDTVAGDQVAFWAIDASELVESDELDRWMAALHDWLGAAEDQSRD